jgi:AcrR family transcriptional regulator
MPRDKTLSHARVLEAIKAEFMEKGFEGASIRSIGARAGMTSAGLYRHYPDKEAMFGAVVDPLIEEMYAWARNHKRTKFKQVENKADKSDLMDDSFIDMIIKVVIPQKEECRLLLTAARGTKYEGFIHDFVLVNQNEIYAALEYLKENGFNVREIDREEMHMLLSAYVTACFEPIVHNYDNEKIKEYMKTMYDFFMPGWYKIMGLN